MESSSLSPPLLRPFHRPNVCVFALFLRLTSQSLLFRLPPILGLTRLAFISLLGLSFLSGASPPAMFIILLLQRYPPK
jgi:hypothetical protein